MAPVILEMDVHCYGCAKKIRKAIKNMAGVAGVSASVDTGQVVVEGTADAAALQARLQAKLRKAVTIVSYGAEPEPDYDPPSPPHYPPPPPPAGPPMGGVYQPYWYGGMPPPHPQYAPPPPLSTPHPAGGYYHPYGDNPSATYGRQYVPNDGPTFFNDENPNACSIQ